MYREYVYILVVVVFHFDGDEFCGWKRVKWFLQRLAAVVRYNQVFSIKPAFVCILRENSDCVLLIFFTTKVDNDDNDNNNSQNKNLYSKIYICCTKLIYCICAHSSCGNSQQQQQQQKTIGSTHQSKSNVVKKGEVKTTTDFVFWLASGIRSLIVGDSQKKGGK